MKKIDRKKITERLGVSHVCVSLWLNGTNKPKLDKAFVLKDEFGIPIEAWRDIKKWMSKKGMR